MSSFWRNSWGINDKDNVVGDNDVLQNNYDWYNDAYNIIDSTLINPSNFINDNGNFSISNQSKYQVITKECSSMNKTEDDSMDKTNGELISICRYGDSTSTIDGELPKLYHILVAGQLYYHITDLINSA
ncbi:hypothetical protein FRACYDRAFT_254323 [Fragilariopsis cylindrus CCMP1102]|uniref:Uncharacterized protein n=1 Tax=Fragilariopsis cylindrus CCMP1102 TaxID=635003 RepID=A0A1E7EL60_9STRA|nr:hypothetical protein FRACYDRAFT_254323 [Fragilariopsis cylindrus CCMP1102]|eukprot:OEU06597.1 hypothetical protein FRACYDRAFT_254323 [Fragilariopsis cylindrus CCMP1102]